jgi:hypothetical protein
MTCTAGIHAARLCKQQSCISSTPIHTQLTSKLHIKVLALHSTYTPLPYSNHGPPLTIDAQARCASFCSRPSRSHIDAARSPSSKLRSCVQTRAKQSASLQRGCSSAPRPRRTRLPPSRTGEPRGSRPRAGQHNETIFLYTQHLRENGRPGPAERRRGARDSRCGREARTDAVM